MGQAMARYPAAVRLSLAEELHGQAVSDPYRWLEDDRDPRTIAWLAAQQDLLATEQARWLVSRWHATLEELNANDTETGPVWRGDRAFTARHRAGADHPVVMLAGHPLLSPLALDPSGLVTLEAWRPSLEGGLLAYQLSAAGTEDASLRVMRVADGSVVDGPINRVRRTPVAWLPGGTHYYYVRRLPPELHPGEERYHRRVYLHRVGTDPARDVEVFGDGEDKTRFYWVTVTPDGRWLTIRATTGADPGTDIWLADLTTSPLERPRFQPVQVGTGALAWLHLLPGTSPGDPMWLRTTSGAERGRILTGSAPGGRSREPWRELIAERPDAVLAAFLPLTGPALRRPLGLVAWIRHAVSEITVHDLSDGAEVGTVPLPGAGTAGDFMTRPEGGHEAWFSYADHRRPHRVLRYDAVSGQCHRWSAAAGPDPAGPDPAGVIVRQAAFPSRDGTIVWLFIVSAAGHPDRRRPAILTGYGGFGVSMSPAYSAQAIAWARAGGVYAIACLRGGGEEGRGWHEDGRRDRKQNVFDDFDAAADHLVAAGWTAPGRLGLLGRSNGGLLVGAALTQHPDKYAAVVCVSPLLDMVRYEQSGMGPSWRAEYGSAADPAGLRVLLSYSPYHRVREGVRYPAVLFTVADGDTRVDPGHARKMCAALQHATTGTGPVLIRVDHGVGHGITATSRQVAQQAECLAFLARELGLPPPPAAGRAG
jgi:prolyl oligopeptidase